MAGLKYIGYYRDSNIHPSCCHQISSPIKAAATGFLCTTAVCSSSTQFTGIATDSKATDSKATDA